MMKDLALEHVAGRIGDCAYLEQMARLRAESSTRPNVQPAPVDLPEAAAFIEGIAATWELATPAERARPDHRYAGHCTGPGCADSPDRPVGVDRARIEHQMRHLALEHVADRIDDGAYLERLGQLRGDLAKVDATPRGHLAAERAVEWLRVLADTWQNADVPEAKADLLHAIYDRIVVAGHSIVSARLTPAAYSNGLALALPHVAVARPEGVGRALATYEVRIEGRDDWLAAARRLA